MKKILFLLMAIVMVFALPACRQSGKANNASVTVGKSSSFTQQEIDTAVSAVEKKFKDFKGCTLTKLWYDEEKSNNLAGGYLQNQSGSDSKIKGENVIVLLSDFKVDSSGGDGSLNPNSTYSGWNWILVRDSKADKWKVVDWGY